LSGVSSGIYLIDSQRHNFDAILADDNGHCINEGTPSSMVHFDKVTGSCITVHKQKYKDQYFIKKRIGRKYLEELVNNDSVFILQRYYRRHSFHKDFLNLICRIKSLSGESKRYILIINEKNDSNKENFTIPCHGNATTTHAVTKPYLRTEKKVAEI